MKMSKYGVHVQQRGEKIIKGDNIEMMRPICGPCGLREDELPFTFGCDALCVEKDQVPRE